MPRETDREAASGVFKTIRNMIFHKNLSSHAKKGLKGKKMYYSIDNIVFL